MKEKLITAVLILAVAMCSIYTGCDSMTSMGDSNVSLPETPSSVKATKHSSTSVQISWSAVSNASSYYVFYSTSSSFSSSSTYVTVSSASTIITGLSAKRTYYFWIAAVNSTGSGEISDSASVSM